MTAPLPPQPPGSPMGAAGSGFTAGSLDLYAHQIAPQGPSERCPHCNGVAFVDPNQELGRVCKLCGGPRILLPDGVASTPELLASLRQAETLRRSRGRWRGIGIFGGLGFATALFFSLIVVLIAGFGWAVSLGAIFGSPVLLALVLGLTISNGKTPQIARQMDAAWLAAATAVARAGKGSTPSALATALGIDLGKAEQLHAMLAVEAITDHAAPVEPDPRAPKAQEPQRVRIVTHPDARGHVETTLPPDPRFEALEAKLSERGQAAQAEAEAEAEAQNPSASAGVKRVT